MNEEAISHLKAKDKRLAKVIDAVGEIEIQVSEVLSDCWKLTFNLISPLFTYDSKCIH